MAIVPSICVRTGEFCCEVLLFPSSPEAPQPQAHGVPFEEVVGTADTERPAPVGRAATPGTSAFGFAAAGASNRPAESTDVPTTDVSNASARKRITWFPLTRRTPSRTLGVRGGRR